MDSFVVLTEKVNERDEFSTYWHTAPPMLRVPYIVRRDEWRDDGRHIHAWAYVGSTDARGWRSVPTMRGG